MVLAQKNRHIYITWIVDPDLSPSNHNNIIFDKNTYWRKDPFQQTMLGKLDAYMQVNETGFLTLILHTKQLQVDQRPQCKI